MKILLTGSHGYIGAVTGRVLVDAGHDVTGLDSYLYAGCDLGPDDPAHAAIPKDVRDVDASELGCYDAIVNSGLCPGRAGIGVDGASETFA